MTSQEFATKIYVPSKPKATRDLFEGKLGIPGPLLSPEDNERKCFDLARAGYLIDPLIEASQTDPLLTMLNRIQRGLTRTPSLLQKLPPVWLDPGVKVPGVPSYDATKWDILVSINPADYPPASDLNSPTVKYVGPYAGNGLYNPINSPEKVFKFGEIHYEDTINYQLLVPNVVGQIYWFYLGKG